MIENCYVEFGAWMREQRMAARLSQVEVARALGISRGSVANIERGAQRLLLHRVEEIRAAFAPGGSVSLLVEDGILAAAERILAARAKQEQPDGR